MINDLINKSMINWFGRIEKELRRIKEENYQELSDEDFAKMMVVEFHLDDISYAIIRLKTVDELLEEVMI